MRRLGWSGLTLEPEHLAERLAEALRRMGGDVALEVASNPPPNPNPNPNPNPRGAARVRRGYSRAEDRGWAAKPPRVRVRAHIYRQG